ncbi:nuclear factor 1 A-type [Pelobates cultripes]|uniref:Nuclear factor 1 A-type n=1 Tax=Pelobates cultripes TaxID=61616 RepID=A0AAD1SU10_PELCU|nr:nuclear factor 1 A-type [Pelobates cultripes]
MQCRPSSLNTGGYSPNCHYRVFPLEQTDSSKIQAYSTPSTSPANRFVSVGPRDPSFVNIPQQTQSWYLG